MSAPSLTVFASPTVLVAAFALVMLAAGPAPAADGGRPLSATLSGAAEKPGPGDPDGTGQANLRVNLGQGEICYDIAVGKIANATMAHIHKAPADAAGPVVVALGTPKADGKSDGCVKADPAALKDILQNPAAYYVNVHNADFPAGAVRGQLSK